MMQIHRFFWLFVIILGFALCDSKNLRAVPCEGVEGELTKVIPTSRDATVVPVGNSVINSNNTTAVTTEKGSSSKPTPRPT